MDVISPKTIKELLLAQRTTPSKTLGQNFLIDKRYLEKILTAADIQPGETVVEVGPGLGTLTRALAEKANHVVAIEKDAAMVAILQKTLEGFKNVEIVTGDALDYSLPTTHYKLIANLPYYITSPLIRKFLEAPLQPADIVIMVQKEVAQRICAKPPAMNLLAASVQFYAKPKIVSYVPKSCFWPAPNVDSAIIKITPLVTTWNISPSDFFTITKAAFSHPRKQLANNFSTAFDLPREKIAAWLAKNNINQKQRAETLKLEDLISLTESYSKVLRLKA